MRIVIPGGTGQVGGILRRRCAAAGHDVVVLSRQPETLEPGVRHRAWDGRTVGDWAEELDGADVVRREADASKNQAGPRGASKSRAAKDVTFSRPVGLRLGMLRQ
ncbi:hypothetical protein GCM10023350_22650 [Nocardioides endophyticus]|uniref:NAD-dependent epimerase/dehydratase domain-containing protein n=1 Tax=Nocardioides endophyticus TaxID=1353775 RepID=A0ABP8YV30_9ACTN